MNLIKDQWKDFFDETWNRDIVVWGTGQIASDVIWLLKKKRNICHIVDSDLSKVGNLIWGHVIESPEQVFDTENDYVVLICSRYVTDISKKLDEYGVIDYYAAYFMTRKDFADKIFTEQPEEKQLMELRDILSDEKSTQLLDKMIEKRKNGEIDYSDIMTSPEYLLDEIFSFSENEVYVDAGAFDGDTVLDFVQKVQSFNKIYAFEPDPENFHRMNMRLELAKQVYDNKIKCLNMAVSDHNGTVQLIASGDVSARVTELEEARVAKVNCATLDILAKDATYIKMDIEGSELHALMGAARLIKQNKPKLAICIYHRPEDLWEIALFIHSLVPEYKLYIRHHSNGYWDTVLYATI